MRRLWLYREAYVLRGFSLHHTTGCLRFDRTKTVVVVANATSDIP